MVTGQEREPLRVLHVLPHRGGGAETYISMLERLNGIEHRRFYLSSGRTPVAALTSVPRRWRRLRSAARAADLLHCHGDAASLIVLPLLKARPAIITTQGLHLLRRLRGVRRHAMQRALAAVIARSHAVVCSSAAEYEDLLAFTPPGQRQKLRLIHNAVDPVPAPSDTTRAAARHELGATSDTTLALFVGQLEPRKRPLLAARAAVRAHQLGARIRLLIVGAGPQAAELQPLIGDVVQLLGQRDDVSRLMQAADVFVQPSEREGMSFALLEALSHGLAIVAADASSNPEAVGDAGLLFPAGDESACAATLHRLAADAGLRHELSVRARHRAAERFAPAAFLQTSHTLYTAAVRGPGRDGRGRPA